jgi:hypothetical protein
VLWAVLLLPVAWAWGADTEASAPGAPSPWTWHASLAVKEAFDDNVFLQSVTSNAYQESFITTVLPAVNLGFGATPAFSANLSYAPEINRFHSESSEDFTLHRCGLLLGGKLDTTTWELNESFVAIDGSDLGPSYYGKGGAPAGGGPQIRDRRDAIIERGQFRLTQNLGPCFLRPVVSGYLHDFGTIQKLTPGYQNFVDRTDWNGGLDAGANVTTNLALALGWRYGEQRQDQLLTVPGQCNSAYQRVLCGVEGSPWPWLKLTLSAGPEFRTYAGSVPPGFVDHHEVYAFTDSSITLLPTKNDTVALSARRLELPSFTGPSAFRDSTYDLTWRHKTTSRLTLGAGVRGYNTDFLQPASRNDWIVTFSVLANYNFTSHLNAEVSYLYDNAQSKIPDTPGREYTRQLVSLGVKWVFK